MLIVKFHFGLTSLTKRSKRKQNKKTTQTMQKVVRGKHINYPPSSTPLPSPPPEKKITLVMV